MIAVSFNFPLYRERAWQMMAHVSENEETPGENMFAHEKHQMKINLSLKKFQVKKQNKKHTPTYCYS